MSPLQFKRMYSFFFLHWHGGLCHLLLGWIYQKHYIISVVCVRDCLCRVSSASFLYLLEAIFFHYIDRLSKCNIAIINAMCEMDIACSLHIYMYIIIIMTCGLARIFLTLSLHVSLSFIASGRSSGLHPVSLHNCCMNVRAGRPAFDWPYGGGGLQEHITYDLVLASPAVSGMPGSSSLYSYRDRW